MDIKHYRVEKSSKYIYTDEVYILPTLIFKKNKIGNTKSVSLKFLWIKKWVSFLIIYQ